MLPKSDEKYPLSSGLKRTAYLKPIIKNPNIIVGDYTHYDDNGEAPHNFEKNVLYHYDFLGDKLIIGKFCQIASGVEFIMNGANHQMNAISTFPFYIFKGWRQGAPSFQHLPLKGDTVIGNDVWIGQNAVMLPGVHIGDGAIIGANSVVSKSVESYTIAVGNPALPVRKRFDEELISLLLKFKWWDLPVQEINKLIPLLSCADLNDVKMRLKERLQG